MSDDKIVTLVPPKEEEGHKEETLTVEELLEKMQEGGKLEEVIVIGLGETGGMVIGSNLKSTSQVNMLLDAAKFNLIMGEGVDVG